jgi:hypothetical protein
MRPRMVDTKAPGRGENIEIKKENLCFLPLRLSGYSKG